MFYLNWVSWTTAHIQFSFKNSNVVGTEPHHNFKKSNDFFHRYSNPSKYPQNHIQSTLLVTHHQHGEIDFMNEFYECKCKPWLSYIKKKSKQRNNILISIGPLNLPCHLTRYHSGEFNEIYRFLMHFSPRSRMILNNFFQLKN